MMRRGGIAIPVAAMLVTAMLVTAMVVAVMMIPARAGAVELRVKDLASLSDGGTHKLIGYGLIVGLQGTGDGKKAIFTMQALANMLEEFGLTIAPSQLEVDNVAAVMITAELPADTSVGMKLDVTVSSMGDAKSLQGGTLLLSPLRGADGEVYAIAQGSVSIGGYNGGSGSSNVQKNHSAVGRVPNGASIVKALSSTLLGAQGRGRHLMLQLHQADFTTAQRLADTINERLEGGYARVGSANSVEVALNAGCADVMALIARIENMPIEPDMPARVVINERTGTVVIGSRVRILPVAIAHGALTVKTQREYQVSQPPPLIYEDNSTVIAAPAESSEEGAVKTEAVEIAQKATLTKEAGGGDDTAAAEIGSENKSAVQVTDKHGGVVPIVPGGGRTVVVPKDTVEVAEEDRSLLPVGGEATLQDLTAALNALGVKPRDLIAIIQALKEAGALQAELIIQ
jgi:flagellar P-ring protein FlgI